MTEGLRRYKVWDRTTRVFHWLNAIAVLSLAVIGTLILNHDLLGIEQEGSLLLKKLHVLFGYVFAINLAWRLVWAFIGGHYARWRRLLPFGRHYLKSLKTYIGAFFRNEPERNLGHNPLGRLMIAAMLLALSLQAISGLILAGTDLYYPPFGRYFAEWVTDGDPGRMAALEPGDKSQVVADSYEAMRDFRNPVITTHYYLYYVLLALIALHIVGVVITEIRGKNGLISAMITGEKVLDEAPTDQAD